MAKVAIRDEKGHFIKGHPVLPGSEKGWFSKEKSAWDKHPRFKTGKWSYQQFIKSECENCNSGVDLQVHHLDKNRNNNNIENLKTVCRPCHWTYHLGKIPWNKGKKTGNLSEKHKLKIGKGVRNFYAK